MPDDPLVSDTEAQRWRDYLSQFERDVYGPVFAAYGFTLPEAFLAWQMNRVNNNVGGLQDVNEETAKMGWFR